MPSAKADEREWFDCTHHHLVSPRSPLSPLGTRSPLGAFTPRIPLRTICTLSPGTASRIPASTREYRSLGQAAMGRPHLHAQRVERRAAREHSAHAVVAHAPARRHIQHLRPPIRPIPPHPAHPAGERRRAPRGDRATGGTRRDRWHGRSLRRPRDTCPPSGRGRGRGHARRGCARARRAWVRRESVRALWSAAHGQPVAARHGPAVPQPVVARRATVAARRLPHGPNPLAMDGSIS